MSGTGSSWAPVLSGVPQGSVLGQILFLNYVNDMPDVVRSLIYMYANDTKIVQEMSSPLDSDSLQHDLDCLQTELV